MPGSQICDNCEQLLIEPEHLQILCKDFAFYNSENTLFWQRRLDDLTTGASHSCRLCRMLIDEFKLDASFWDGCDSIPRTNQGCVVFALCIMDIAPLVLEISLQAPDGSMDKSTSVCFELLTSSGWSSKTLLGRTVMRLRFTRRSRGKVLPRSIGKSQCR